ncbi:MAG: hypothetical protein ABEH88_02590 [Halobacteriales archaeon]
MSDRPIRANPSNAVRLQNWEWVEKVVDETTVDVGFDEHHPKEPAAAHHRGTVYVVSAVWNEYRFPPSHKELVLLRANSPTGPFEQIGRVTDGNGFTGHAPGILIEDGELNVLYSHRVDGQDDIRLKRTPVDSIPVSPEGWNDEGVVLRDARDPGVVKSPGGSYHVVAKDERADGVVRVTGPALTEMGTRRTTMYTNSFGEAPEVVPKSGADGYWLVTAEGIGEGPRFSAAGEGDTLRDEFEGYYVLGTHRGLNGIRKPFHEEWTLHHDYLYDSGGVGLYRKEDRVFAYFEAGNGSQFSIGVGVLFDEATSPREWASHREITRSQEPYTGRQEP